MIDAAIRFRDSAGREWRVFERDRATPRGSQRVLVFDCSASLRCVLEYPDDWRRLSPEALERISWRV